MTREELKQRIDTVEQAYEFFLAYAAQGVSGEAGSDTGEELRSFLEKSERALLDLVAGFSDLVSRERPEPADSYRELSQVLGRDAGTTRAAIQAILARPAISSQLIDNFNASIHVRALLTDLFLLDELLAG
ncbi:MAG: hypothetical protein ACE5PT_01630 [Gemmatimonadales bacterium]